MLINLKLFVFAKIHVNMLALEVLASILFVMFFYINVCRPTISLGFNVFWHFRFGIDIQDSTISLKIISNINPLKIIFRT